ncbi:acetyl-CoA synthetase-like protein [Fistulina hepatica ATCC 64428]|uniref:Acetyl-CoA synthetase-like protein n=1 Tax=Fistulina hepatica ATCC 64428 TaxID=1128425 RepID=A0A0D7A444_9AGAR|nr:acetyl-CoA synthetase-like protein [Fistulina hepatica ATCC 64428]
MALHFVEKLLTHLSSHPPTLPIVKYYVGPGWETVTHGQFLGLVVRAAEYWTTVLAGFPKGVVVGLWLTGQSYTDLVHIYACALAGYVPQVFSIKFSIPGGEVVRDLLSVFDGKAILYDEAFSPALGALLVPKLRVPDMSELPEPKNDLQSLLKALPRVEELDKGIIFHTSGTTQGKPKPIPAVHRWLRNQADPLWPSIWQSHTGPRNPDDGTQDVFNSLGSFAHIGTATMINHDAPLGSAIVQTPPSISLSTFTEETLKDLMDAGVNSVFLYAPWLSKLLRIAREDEKTLELLKSLRQITYTGASLNPEDEKWMVNSGIRAVAMYATTEVCLTLCSPLDRPHILPAMKPLPHVGCRFIETNAMLIGGDYHTLSQLDDDAAFLHNPDLKKSQILYDLFIPADSHNCPHPSVRNRDGGHVTGDLFEKVIVEGEEFWLYRGRNDDWIRTGPGLTFCDTKSIEDNILLTCSPGLIKNCTVVGHNCLGGIVLFIEAAEEALGTEASKRDPLNPHVLTGPAVERLKQEVLSRHTPYQSRLFAHERIRGPGRVVVVTDGSLGRTKEKGNIRRKAVEDEYAALLESIYATT